MDIDIDVSDNKRARQVLKVATRASIVEDNDLKAHTVGLYFQNIPKDLITGYAAIPYDMAEDFGYMKVDILNLSFLENFTSKQQIRKLLKREPKWSLLTDDNVIREFRAKKSRACIMCSLSVVASNASCGVCATNTVKRTAF